MCMTCTMAMLPVTAHSTVIFIAQADMQRAAWCAGGHLLLPWRLLSGHCYACSAARSSRGVSL